MKKDLNKIKDDILRELKNIKESGVLRDLEVKYLGRKGELTKILRGIADLSVVEKKKIGKTANKIKEDIKMRISEARAEIEGGQAESGFIDVTLPGSKIQAGHLHPVTLIMNELDDLFASMGFMVLDGPELESDYYNFEALNIPRWHPARDMQDTFYIDHKNKNNEYDLVMRTQTSSMQVRTMQKYGAPLRCAVLGRVFRNEATDAVHEHTLHQIEGLMIGKDISIANLISVLKEMISGVLRQSAVIRVRPGYFPFVEPGLEVDIRCTICNGKKCPSCKNSGWLEMLGAGMVHPNVLKAGNVDPDKYSGFAFGMGIDRLVMMKYGINDIRNLMSGDLRFLEQF